MSVQSILVLTDFTPREDSAMHRARHLAAEHGAALKLLHFPSQDGVQFTEMLIARAAAISKRLEGELGREVQVIMPQSGRFEDVLATEARVADLVVVPERRERSVTALFHGPPVIRLLRVISAPVLVTRPRPIERYSRILVATALRGDADRLGKFAAELEPTADIELFHALDTRDEAKLRSAEAPERVVAEFRRRRTEYAQQRMHGFASKLQITGVRTSSFIGRGDPGQQLAAHQGRTNASLVVVGKTKASAWGDFFCGSVADRVLSWSASDMLVLPKEAAPEATGAAGSGSRREDLTLGEQPASTS